MEETFVKYPIGIQTFPEIIQEGYKYVDKTEYVWKLTRMGKVFFLGRPRRFGKSLFLSTLESYFLGRRELFKGLAIEKYEKDWLTYPVLRIDLNAENYDSEGSLINILERFLRIGEDSWGRDERDVTLQDRFFSVIRRAHQKTGQKVVVLIDEYDKPLLSTINNPTLYDIYKNTLKAFYGVLKSSDEHLKFVFLTGVTKFGQVSVFSDLNQVKDISMDSQYSTICGITQEELESNFQEGIVKLAAKYKQTYQETIERLEKQYDGYHFCEDSPRVYNPFSTLNVLASMKYSNYWFRTGTPTFLMELIKKSNYDIRNLEGVQLSADSFSDYKADISAPIPVIYQSGYLTIKGYDREFDLYTLGYPNEEVKKGFLEFMVPYYTGLKRDSGEFDVSRFYKELTECRIDDFLTRLRACFAGIPYDMQISQESYYQTIFYLVFRLLGIYVEAEVKSATGRADAVVRVPGYLYVFEFKLNDTAEAAMQQINDKGYLIPYTAPDTDTKLVKVGVGFSTETKNIDKWIVD